MTKKTIILVLITLLVINTIYWLNVTIKVFGFSVDSSDNKRLRELRREKEKLPGEWRKPEPTKDPRGFDLSKYFSEEYFVDVDKLSKEEYEKYEKIEEGIRIILERMQRRSRTFTNRLVRVFQIGDRETVPFIILAITDIVLIAISFMIILLYKERTIGDKK